MNPHCLNDFVHLFAKNGTARLTTIAVALLIATGCAGTAPSEGTSTSSASGETAGQPLKLPTEPDYEEEKLRFQRGTEPYYGLAAYDLKQAEPQATRADAQALAKSAANGDMKTQYLLGISYARGTGVPQDYALAHEWFRKAASRGYAKAQIFLGVMSEQGRGTAQDYVEARRWYEKAARRNADAQFLLGLMYFQGKGVPLDYGKAHRWFWQAAGNHSTEAQVNLGWMAEYGRGGEQDYTLAMRNYLKAAKRGDTLAEYNVGTLHYQGKGVPQDNAQAALWLQKAADKDYAPAYYSLGVIAFTSGTERDALAAYRWFSLARLADYPGVRYNVDRSAAELTPQQRAQADTWIRDWQAVHRR